MALARDKGTCRSALFAIGRSCRRPTPSGVHRPRFAKGPPQQGLVPELDLLRPRPPLPSRPSLVPLGLFQRSQSSGSELLPTPDAGFSVQLGAPLHHSGARWIEPPREPPRNPLHPRQRGNGGIRVRRAEVPGRELNDVAGCPDCRRRAAAACVPRARVLRASLLGAASRWFRPRGRRSGAGAAPVRRIKVYTRTGDKGKSSLYNGDRALKDDAVFEALGDVDELSACLGLAREHCLALEPPSGGEARPLADVEAKLAELQSRLIDVGTAIATPPKEGMDEAKTRLAAFGAGHAAALEGWIDSMDAELPPLKNFILPSGGLAAAQLHVARCVCRRAERRVVPLVRDERVEPAVGVFLNRLSDALFVAARLAAKRAERTEVIYAKARS